MPSSTSDSDASPPPGPWRRTGALAAALCVVTLGAVEAWWRAEGHRPSIHDDADVWTLARAEADESPRPTLVLGASRIQLGLDLAAYAEETGGPQPIQLAINGSSPVPLLRRLAEDESFAGTLLCGITYLSFTRHPLPAELSERWANRLRERPLWWSLEAPLRLGLGSALVFRAPYLLPHELLRAWSPSFVREKLYLRTLPDRSRIADYSLFPRSWREARERVLAEDVVRHRQHGAVDAERLAEVIEDAARRIRARGGEVVLIRMPSSGAVREAERRHFPRDRFWDALAARPATRAVHFEDHPELARFVCPDGSHLDASDRSAFTTALVRVIQPMLSETDESRVDIR